jgi:hypothetical protein
MISDLELYNRERKQEASGVPSRFTLQCSIFDVVDLEYIYPVEFCEDIIEGTFEARVMTEINVQADHIAEDIRNCFDMFVNRISCKLLRVYNHLNEEIK